MFSLLSLTPLTKIASSTSLSELDHVTSLKEALEGIDALLNDDLSGKSYGYRYAHYLGAEKILANGSSAFHKTGGATVSFLRALIGFEKELMKEGNSLWKPELTLAMERFTEAEAAAERQRKLAIQDNHSQGRYAIGIPSQKQW
jgi:hypothetical protein